jgi:hypothetical protein
MAPALPRAGAIDAFGLSAARRRYRPWISTVRRMSFHIVLRIVAGLAAIGAVWAGALFVLMLAGHPVPPVDVAAQSALLFITPSIAGFFIAFVIVYRRGQGTLFSLIGRTLRHLSMWARIAFGIVALTFLVGLWIASDAQQGYPDLRHGQHVLVNPDNQAVTVVDQATYDRAVLLNERASLGGLGAVGVFGCASCLAFAAQLRSDASKVRS